MKLIIGLGNPGQTYEKTRHNLGFMILDGYAKKQLGPEIVWTQDNKFRAEILKLNQNIWLIKPQTFMNDSGQAVKALVDYYKISLSDVIVIHDDLDLLLGKIKVKQGGSAGGHHGVESVINFLGDGFVRVRLGIGNLRSESGERGGQHFGAEQFVLEKFLPNERAQVKQMLKKAVLALELLLEEGIEKAQNQYN